VLLRNKAGSASRKKRRHPRPVARLRRGHARVSRVEEPAALSTRWRSRYQHHSRQWMVPRRQHPHRASRRSPRLLAHRCQWQRQKSGVSRISQQPCSDRARRQASSSRFPSLSRRRPPTTRRRSGVRVPPYNEQEATVRRSNEIARSRVPLRS